ncbi:MAG: hypothetical protein Q8T08_01510, partial [Ignavibacteria bacterium]|nr:hypothetical protein [Ignavibacteria bacterium]
LSLSPYYEALLKVNKGFLAHNQANTDLAIQLMNQAMVILDPYEEYKEEKLRAITNLIQYYVARGEWEKTGELIKNGEKLCKNLPCESCICFFLYALSLTLSDQGKFQQALDVINKVNVYPLLSVEYPPIYHGVTLQKIETLIKLGKIDEAKTSLSDLEKKLKEFYGKKTTAQAYVLILKSMVLLRQAEERPQAFEMIKDALEMYNKSFQGQIRHRAQARAHMVFGKAHSINEEHEKALKEYLLSEKIYNAVLKENRIDDVSDLYKELAILGAKIKNEALVHKYLNAHIHTFGHSHPRTEEIILYLDKAGIGIPF